MYERKTMVSSKGNIVKKKETRGRYNEHESKRRREQTWECGRVRPKEMKGKIRGMSGKTRICEEVQVIGNMKKE